jgi:hypothetical protein
MVASIVETLEALGFFRKLMRSAHIIGSQLPWRSSRLKTKLLALTSALASACETGSGYALCGTLLFGDANPPRCAQMLAPSGQARYWMSAFAWGVLVSIIATSPAPWIALPFALSAAGAGKEKKL